MGDDDTTRLWLIERSYDDHDLVILIYATPDGKYEFRKELAAAAMYQCRITVAIAIDVPAEDLEPIDNDDLRERYATEAARMAGSHGPDGRI